MSCELLDVPDDQENNSILITMVASGVISLTVLDGKIDENIARYIMQPDATGVENAKSIAEALLGWIDHIKESNLYRQ